MQIVDCCFYYLAHTPEHFRATCQDEHRAIVLACQDGDTQRAVSALKLHLQHAGEVVVRYSETLRAAG